MALERIEIKLPDGFDPARHAKALPAAVEKSGRGSGWEVESVDMVRGFAQLTRQVAVMEVTETNGASGTEPTAFEIRLPAGTKLTDGDRVAARQADAHPGYHLVRFEPHVGKAVLAKVSDDELRCRGAVANALSVKPWDVMVASRSDGGFSLQLPGAYTPSKHDDKLAEVAESIVGRFGWYVQVDPKTLVAQIIPSDPPTFPDVIPLNLKNLGKNPMRTPFGLKLPPPGKAASEPVELDWKAQSWALLTGTPGSGKTVSINNIIADHLAAGGELYIVDDASKAIDFNWAKPFVADGGWGCGGLREAVTTLSLMYERGQARAEKMAELGYVNWIDMPEEIRFKPVLLVFDEFSAMTVTDKIPAGIDKKLPEIQELIEANMLRFKVQSRVRKIMAEQRFVAARALVSLQVSNASTGMPPSMKSLFGHKALQGTNPSRTQRQQTFSVEASVPQVPQNLIAGGMASKGVGAAELESQAPCVYKGFYASVDDLAAELVRRDVPTTNRPDPTEAEMDRLCPTGDTEFDEEAQTLTAGETLPSGKPISSLDPKYGPGPVALDEHGRPLKGAAAAAHASKALTEPERPKCPSCDRPIAPDGGCGCSW